MSSISAGLGSYGALPTIEWNGRQVGIQQLEWSKIISKLEMFLIERSLKIKKIGWRSDLADGLITQDQYEAKVDAFTSDCVDNGTYSFGRPVMMQILGMAEQGEKPKDNNPVFLEGYIKLVSLLTGLDENDTVSMLAAKGEELSEKLSLALKMSMPSPKAEGANQAPQNLSVLPS